MQQITLGLDDADDRPSLTLESEQNQQLIAAMAQAIVAVLQSQCGDDHEPE